MIICVFNTIESLESVSCVLIIMDDFVNKQEQTSMDHNQEGKRDGIISLFG